MPQLSVGCPWLEQGLAPKGVPGGSWPPGTVRPAAIPCGSMVKHGQTATNSTRTNHSQGSRSGGFGFQQRNLRVQQYRMFRSECLLLLVGVAKEDSDSYVFKYWRGSIIYNLLYFSNKDWDRCSMPRDVTSKTEALANKKTA